MSDFNPNLKQTPPEVKNEFNVEFIKSNVSEIQEIISQNPNTDPFDLELKFMESHAEFYQQHPFLVKKLCKKEDISMLFTMLSNLSQVENGEKSLASVELNLGNQLANKYIYPKMNK
jgi:hypothetical protein